MRFKSGQLQLHSARIPSCGSRTPLHRGSRGTLCCTGTGPPPPATPPAEENIISKVRDAFLFIPSQTLKAVNQGIFASGGADQSGEFGAGQKIAVAAVAVALLIADQLGSSRYVISHAVEAVYGGPHLFVTGTSTAADNKYEEALAAGRVTSLDDWYREKLIAQYVESGQCPDAATSEWCAKNAPR